MPWPGCCDVVKFPLPNKLVPHFFTESHSNSHNIGRIWSDFLTECKTDGFSLILDRNEMSIDSIHFSWHSNLSNITKYLINLLGQ